MQVNYVILCAVVLLIISVMVGGCIDNREKEKGQLCLKLDAASWGDFREINITVAQINIRKNIGGKDE